MATDFIEDHYTLEDYLASIDRTLSLAAEFEKKLQSADLPGKIRLLQKDRERIADIIEASGGKGERLPAFGAAPRHIVSFYQNMRIFLAALTNTLQCPLDFTFTAENEAFLIDYCDQMILGIYAFLDDDGILRIRLPLLPHATKPSVGIRNGKNSFYIHSTKVYAAEVKRSMDLLFAEHPEIFSRFQRKTMHFLYNMEKDSPMMDSDHHETEPVINAVTEKMQGGDGALSCSFTFSSVLDERIPSGTYLSVLPEKDTGCSIENTIAFWKKKLAEIHYFSIEEENYENYTEKENRKRIRVSEDPHPSEPAISDAQKCYSAWRRK